MFNIVTRRLNWQGRNARAAVAVALCMAALGIGAGSGTLLAQLGGGSPAANTAATVNSAKCQDAGHCTTPVITNAYTACSLNNWLYNWCIMPNTSVFEENYTCATGYPGHTCHHPQPNNTGLCETFKIGHCLTYDQCTNQANPCAVGQWLGAESCAGN